MPNPPNRPALLVALLALLSLVGYALRSNITIAQEFMAPELGLSMADMGVVTGLGFQLAYAVFQIPAGFLGDRFGARLVLGLAVVGWALTSFASGLVGAGTAAIATLFLSRLLLGVAQAPTYPVGSMAIREGVPLTRQTTANSIFISSSLLGSALAPLTLAPLMAYAGWRSVFIASGIVGLIAAVTWLILAPVPRRSAASSVPVRQQMAAAVRLLRDRDLLVLSLSYLLHSAVFFVFIFWFFRYLTDGRGFDLLSSGLWGSVPPFTAFLLAPLGGLIADRMSRRFNSGIARRRVAVTSLILAGTSVMIGANLDNPYLAIGALSLSVAFINSAEGPFWATATHLGSANPGAAGGLLNFAGNAGGIISILGVPLMREPLGWTGLLGVWAAVSVVAALLWLLIRVDRPAVQIER
jgi:ACS family glucarate transporter-like MFS transporter